MAAAPAFAAQVAAVVRSGTGVHLPFYEALPPLNLVLGKSHLPSLEYGANYFLQLSKVNDLNRMSTDMVELYTHDLAGAEDDLEKVYEAYGIEAIKAYGKGIRADAIVADLSARHKLFKKDRSFVKSNNYLKENNFYVSDYTLLTFEVFRPLFDFGAEKFCIVKLPTLFGRTVVNAVRVYCSLFRTVKLFKCARDSWLKDSAVLVCQDVHAANLDRFLAYVRSATRAPAWREAFNVPFTLLDAPVEREFLDKFLEFSTKVYTALYYVHSLLYSSMASESKSIENEHQKSLMKLLRP
ncbi:mRNA capping enzyme small subunit [Equine molluscum contagiosum-like virus]|nr:mRNA capping enzyme small subunit [Equine molluscum contagiosum-like virus]